MDLERRVETRHVVQRSRRAPREPARIVATFDEGCELGDEVILAPIELTIEPTNAEMETASWFNDFWWTDVIQRWNDCSVTVHIAPTPGALLHPVVLYQLDMLWRVAPNWRIVGHAYTDDIVTDEAIDQLASSPYHEVHFTDQPRPGAPSSDRCTWRRPLEDLFGRIRRAQSRVGAVTPILVRLPQQKTGSHKNTPTTPTPNSSVTPEPAKDTR